MDYTPLASWGIPGFIILTLAGVIIKLYYNNVSLYKQLSILQDKRLDDALIARDKYDTVMGKFSQSFDLFAAKVESKEK